MWALHTQFNQLSHPCACFHQCLLAVWGLTNCDSSYVPFTICRLSLRGQKASYTGMDLQQPINIVCQLIDKVGEDSRTILCKPAMATAKSHRGWSSVLQTSFNRCQSKSFNRWPSHFFNVCILVSRHRRQDIVLRDVAVISTLVNIAGNRC